MEELLPKFRLGVIEPGANIATQAYQFYRILPKDVMFVRTSLGLKGYETRAQVEEAIVNYWKRIDQLVAFGVDRTVQMGIPVSAHMGRSYILDLLEQTQKRTGVPADTALEAVIAGMKHLGVKTVAIGSRWVESTNRAMVDYFGTAGVKVESVTTRGDRGGSTSGRSLEEGSKLAVELGQEAMRLAPKADGILLPGGSWLSLHAIPILEAEFGRPVFTNLCAIVWNGVVRTGVVPPIQGWGRLLARP